MNTKLIELFKEYDVFHQNETNRLTHKIAIPLIFFNLLVMLDWIIPFSFSFDSGNYNLSIGFIVTMLFSYWYFSMSIKLGLMLLPMMLVLLYLGTLTPVWLVIVLGVIGWIVQMLGHVIWEKNSPNFVSNLVQFLVGPIYFLALITGDWVIGEGHAQTQVASLEERS